MSQKVRNVGRSRRRFLQSAAAVGALSLAPQFVMRPNTAAAADLADVHIEAAKAAKELAAGRQVSLTHILSPGWIRG